VLTKDLILNELITNFHELRKFGVEKIGLFGSYTKELENDQSDIDILIKYSSDSLSFDNYMNTKLYLEALFHNKVDLVIDEDLRIELKDEILNSVIYAA
jgi:uncharacterized protein